MTIIIYMYTVEPPKKGHFGIRAFGPCREAGLSRDVCFSVFSERKGVWFFIWPFSEATFYGTPTFRSRVVGRWPEFGGFHCCCSEVQNVSNQCYVMLRKINPYSTFWTL